MKKNLLVTGGSGFIGKNIIEQLGAKYNISAPSHNNLDLSNTEAVEKYFKNHHFDVVIHTANIGGSKAETNIPDVVAYNLRIFSNIMNCHKYFKKMIHLGSGAEFGKQGPIVKVSEDMFGNRIPADDFGLYKFFVAKYIEETNLPITNLRIFGIYGKYEDYRFRFISNIICQILLGKKITVRQNAVFDFLYIDDFISILDHFISHRPKYKTYNLGRGKAIELVALARIIAKRLNYTGQIRILQPGLNNEYTCNTTRLKKEIPDITYSSLESTVDCLAEWYRKKLKSINSDEIIKRI